MTETNGQFLIKSNSGLPQDYVRALAIGIDDKVWVGTLGSGIIEFNGTDWTVYDLQPEIQPNVFSISLDAESNL